MHSKILKIFILLFISIFLFCFPLSVSNGCGGGDWDPDTEVYSFFNPDVMGEPSFSPFFLTYHQWYRDYNEDISEESLNIAEWKVFFNGKANEADLNDIVYKISAGLADSLAENVLKNRFVLPEKVKTNSLLQFSKKKQLAEALKYLAFVKKHQDPVFDEWNPVTPDKNEINKALTEVNLRLQNPLSDFLKMRYLFQKLRFSFQAGEYDNCVNTYEKNFAASTIEGTMKYRAMGYYAAALYKLKNFAKANYLYSLIYDHYPQRKKDAVWSFHPQENKDWETSLLSAKSSREKEVMWHLFGIYADPLLAMKKIYEINPSSDLIDLLLVRSVNAIEKSSLPSTSNFSSADSSDFNYTHALEPSSKEFFAFVSKCSGEGKTKKSYLWDLSAGYLCFLKKDYSSARICFDKIKKNTSAPKLCYEQAALFEVLMKIDAAPVADAKFEDEIFKELSALHEIKDGYHPEQPFDYAMKRLSQKYFMQGDSVKSEVCWHRDSYSGYDYNYYYNRNSKYSFFRNEKNIQSVIDFIDKENKSSFEKFILTLYPIKKSDLIETQAVSAMYAGNIKESIAKFSLPADTGKSELLGNPFNIHIIDCHDCDHEAAQTVKYTKFSFAKKMLEIEQKALKGEADAAQNYFLLANGYYNMSYYGNSRLFRYTAIYSDASETRFYYSEKKSGDKQSLNQFYDCSRAKYFYEKALQLAPNKEFVAKCSWMEAKCELNMYYESDKYNSEKADFTAGNNYKLLKKEYSTTQYYQEVIDQCGYFRNYLGMPPIKK